MLSWKSFGAGVLIFIVFSQILEKLLHLAVIAPSGTHVKWSANPYVFALYGGLAAGIFEEIGRFFAFKVLVKKHHRYNNGLSYGLGHGGIEAILIGGFSAVNSLLVYSMVQSGKLDQLLGAHLPSEQITLIKNQFANATIWLYAAGGMERLFAIALHIALSILVLYGVRQKQFKYVIYAILFHAAVNFIPGLYQAGVFTNILYIEIFLFSIAVLSIIFTIKMKPKFLDKN